MNVLAQVANNVPLLVAILGGVSLIVGAIIVKPPTYKELTEENRALRHDREEATTRAIAAEDATSSLRDEFEVFKADRASERASDHRTIGILSDGVAAMWGYVQVLIADLRSAGRPVPEPSDYVRTTMDAARAVHDD